MCDNMKEWEGETDIVSLEFEFTQTDYIKALEKHLEKSKYMVWLAPLVGLFALFVAYSCFLSFFQMIGALSLPLSFPMGMLMLLSMLAACILLAICFRRKARAARTVRKALGRGVIDPKVFGRQKLEMKENCIEQYCEFSCIRRSYTDIRKIAEYQDGVMLYDQAMQLIIIPSVAFKNKQQQENFLRYVRNRIHQAQNAGIPGVGSEANKQDEDCALQFAWDEQGFIAAMTKANRLLFKSRLGWPSRQIIFILAGLLLIFIGTWYLFSEPLEEVNYIFSVLPGILCLAAGFGLFGNLILVFTPAIKRTIKTQIECGAYSRDYFELQSICLQENKITELRRLNRFDLQYGDIHSILCDKRCVYLLLKGQRALIIPNAAFSTDAQKADFVAYIQNKMRCTK